MNNKCKTAAVLVLAFCVLPVASVAAADEGATHDYSNMGATPYNASGDEDTPANSRQKDDSTQQDSTQASTGSGQASDTGNANGKPYKVDCSGDGACVVSKDVMVGYDEYGGHCLRCHGETARGSSFAPSLVKRLKNKNQAQFTAAVAGGIMRKDPSTGMYKVMPAWAENKEVMSHVQELWAFLKARSDGALPAGRPQVKGGDS